MQSSLFPHLSSIPPFSTMLGQLSFPLGLFGAGANELGDPKADQLIVAYVEGSSIRRWQVHTETGACEELDTLCGPQAEVWRAEVTLRAGRRVWRNQCADVRARLLILARELRLPHHELLDWCVSGSRV